MYTRVYGKERMNRVVSKLGLKKTVVIAVLIMVAVAVFATFVHMNDNSLDFRNRDLRLIITDSMDGEPQPYKIETIPVDTLVMVRLISDEEKSGLQVGDVIQFKSGSILNHHRVIDNSHISDGYVITKGDNASASETVYFGKITGIVIGTNHPLGVVFNFVKTYVYVLLILIVVLYLASMLMAEIAREKKGKAE